MGTGQWLLPVSLYFDLGFHGTRKVITCFFITVKMDAIKNTLSELSPWMTVSLGVAAGASIFIMETCFGYVSSKLWPKEEGKGETSESKTE